jgi:hypothetical protein
MPEIVADGSPFQIPESAANEFYASQTNPGAGSFIASTLGEGPAAFLGRAAERGTQAGSSWFDQALNQLGANEAGAELPEPEQTPTMAPEDYNRLYAPTGPDGKQVSIGDQPMPEGLARTIGQQKSDAMEREGVLSRFANTHSGVTTFAAGAAASMLDPLNAATAFIPGVGEEAIAARLGGGILGRTAGRVVAGAGIGAAAQAPASALRLGLAPEEASDYGMRDALRDVLYSAAGVAALHTGLGSVGELLGRSGEAGQAATAEGATQTPAVGQAAPRALDAQTQNAAMRSAVGEMAEGRPVDVAPVLATANTPEDLLGRAPQRPDDIIDFLMQQGGVQDEGGELHAMDLHQPQKGKFGTLVNRNGLSLDYAREAAEEAGYLPEGSTTSDLLGAIDATSRGNPAFIPEQAAEFRDYQRARFLGPQPEAFDPNDMFGDIADDQREGWAPGLSRDELTAANDAVYGPRPEEATPTIAATPAAIEGEAQPIASTPELAEAEAKLAQTSPGGSFTTSKGSTYQVHEDQTTTRNKSAHETDIGNSRIETPGHEGDVGLKPGQLRRFMLMTRKWRPPFRPPVSKDYRQKVRA